MVGRLAVPLSETVRAAEHHFNNSTAGNATITNDISLGRPSVTLFSDTSTAGNAAFLLPGGDVRFQDNSTAGDAET